MCISMNYKNCNVKLNQRITFGSYEKPNNTIAKKDINENKLFDTDKCVLHLIDLSAIHIANFMCNEHNPKLINCDLIMGSQKNIDTDSSEYGKKGKAILQQHQHLEEIINYITDQHFELWNIMKRGDLIEDVSMSQFNDSLDNINDYLPTCGRYIVDKINADKDLGRLKGSDIIRNGLTIKYLVKDYGPNKITQYTIPIDMYTITDFPIGYFDNILINNYLCPIDKTHTSWNCNSCLISLDVNRLHLDKITCNNIFHVIKTRKDKIIPIDYLYIIITFKGIKYMIISHYSSETVRYDMNVETLRFIEKFKFVQYMDTYNREENNIIKEIAQNECVLIDNVLCI
jgi:hypothetical protein